MSRVREWLDVGATLGVIAVAICAVWTLIRPSVGSAAVAAGGAGVLSKEQQQVIDLPRDKAEFTRGQAVILEFTDYQCPFCRQYSEETKQRVESDLVTSKKTFYVTMGLPLEQIHPLARRAAASAECASMSGKFAAVHKLLFRRGADLTVSGLKDAMASVGISGAGYDECVAGEGDKRVASSMAVASKLGINTTPSFVIGKAVDGRRVMAMRIISGMAGFDAIASAVNEVGRSN